MLRKPKTVVVNGILLRADEIIAVERGIKYFMLDYAYTLEITLRTGKVFEFEYGDIDRRREDFDLIRNTIEGRRR